MPVLAISERISPDHWRLSGLLKFAFHPTIGIVVPSQVSHFTRPLASVGPSEVRISPDHRHRRAFSGSHFTRPFCEAAGEIEIDLPQRHKAQPGQNAFHPTNHPQDACLGRIPPDRMGEGVGSTVSHFTRPRTHFFDRTSPLEL